MDTQTLQTFLLLSKLKNFSITAENLFVAQSTVTNRIAELEKEIGKKLFIRDKKHIELTGEGILFKSYAKQILKLEENAMQEMNQGDFFKHTLRIGSSNTIYECHLYPIISSFLTSNHDTSVKVVLDHSQDLLQLLENQLLDIVFSYIYYKKSGYQCIPFVSDELILVTNPKNNFFINGIYKNNLPKIHYLMCDLALQGTGQFIRSLFPNYYQFLFEIDNSTKLVQYLLDGFGYSFLPKSIVKSYIENDSLISIPLIDFDTPQINSYFVYRTNNHQIQNFLSML
ncbi:LysR family transcriptional regulator [Clostridium ljungdahlii]|uniref:HTH-type transcriptional regulator YofA n=1 Tax=Clostridium ljungdahlii (strain ATCC 55383 / DSM 13528 / PETC) TaxID=748727 RepID=D8GQ43_CLOLD|nr:LysR family transcriptional regulator [Clostridium ljungdahlii]ADK16134.1 transcriptional regulator, LysR family [Clostridium ljungdahlii DSM 13528]OAA84219.1 HTH-type transcriptional regulator YofA [Clostridium ljungdahlii DSM 13528]